MHKTLLKHLKRSQTPVDILLDAASNTKLIHYLSVFLQAIELNRVVSYFYGLIELQDNESGQTLFDIRRFRRRKIGTVKPKMVRFWTLALQLEP